MGCHCEAGDRNLLLIRALLAVDGLLLRLDHVGGLKGTLVLQRTRGQLLALRVLGGKAQVYTRNQILDAHIERLLHGVLRLLAIALDAGRERSEAVELHGLTLRHHLLQTADDVLQHEHRHGVIHELAMLSQVTGETLQVQRLLGVSLGIILAVTGVVLVLVLPEIHRKCNNFTCHFVCSFLF